MDGVRDNMAERVASFLSVSAGSGDGYGYGDGSGDGYGYGDGSGDGYGSRDSIRYFNVFLRDIKSFCGQRVYYVDGIPALIDRVHGGFAKGNILNNDLTLTPCYIAKIGNMFAHGKTAREAINACREKLFDNMSEEERIAAFMEAHEWGKPYPCSDLYDWHHKLTGSCEMGRKEFAKQNNIDIEHDEMTVEEFIALTRGDYGSETICLLGKHYKAENQNDKQQNH